MKQECKKAPDREVRYVAFKSYHTKAATAATTTVPSSTKATKSDSKQSTLDRPTKPAASKKSHKNKLATTSSQQSVSKYKGDCSEQITLQEQLDAAHQKQTELTDALTCLQNENESLKQSLNVSVPVDVHEQLQLQLLESQQKCQHVEVELRRMLQQNRNLQQDVEELAKKVETADGENAELHDRVELSVDKIEYLERKLDRLKEIELKMLSLQVELQTLTSRNEELAATNERVTLTVQNLQNLVDEQNVKMEDYSCLKRKLKTTESEMQKVIDDKEVSSKFVQLLDSENAKMKQKNNILLEQNARLTKDLNDMKKKMELLRQKFDDVNKENKLLKEKEARCMIHERIIVGKYPKYTASIADKEDKIFRAAVDLRPSANSSSSLIRLPSSCQQQQPSAKETQRRTTAKNTNDFEQQIYNLLHRSAENDDRVVKTKIRKN